MTDTPTVSVGDRAVHQLGFGAMRLTGNEPWGPKPPPSRERAEATLRQAVEGGCQLIDTADAYSIGLNETLIADVLAPYDDGLVIATKAGQSRPGGRWTPLGRPEYLKQQVELSLLRLKVEVLDLFQLHRIDPKVEFVEQMGALRELQEEGKVRAVGLSQVSVEQLDRALEIVEVVSVQNKYSVSDRSDDDVLTRCEELGIAFLPWRPLEVSDEDRPRVQGVADELGATTIQVALAWLLQSSPVMLPIPGTANPDHLQENLAARDLTLTDEQIAVLEGAS